MKESLNKFLEAQENQYLIALNEIRSGSKRSHWIWYIFPQLKGLGFSSNSEYYGIKNIEEATAYLQHPVLGLRLVEISNALLLLKVNDPGIVMGYPDDLKLKSCMTLFAAASQTDPIFEKVLQKFFGGTTDTKTLRLLKQNDEKNRA